MIPRKKFGVPYKVRANDSDYTCFIKDVEYKGKPISWKSQNKVFQKWLSNPFQEECYTFLLSCDYDNIIPQLAATAILTKVKEEDKSVFWYNISKNHKHEDERLQEYLEEYLNLDLLIIDGVYTKTNINNIDKLRELLTVFDDIPVYVIISGGFGPDFFSQQVFCAYNLFIHFGDQPRRKVISV